MVPPAYDIGILFIKDSKHKYLYRQVLFLTASHSCGAAIDIAKATGNVFVTISGTEGMGMGDIKAIKVTKCPPDHHPFGCHCYANHRSD